MTPSYLYKYYKDYVIQYDFINVFHYRRIQCLPKLLTIKVYFNQSFSADFFIIFAFIQLLTSKFGKLVVKSQCYNNSLNTKVKQKRVSATFELRKGFLFRFLSKIRKDLFSLKKSRIEFSLMSLNFTNVFVYNIKRLILFDLLKNNYNLFKRLEIYKSLFLSISTNAKTSQEFLFLLGSYQLTLFN